MRSQRKKKNRSHGCHHPENVRCSVCCIIPPYILENLAVNGNSHQREWAFRTLNVSAQFRGRRNIVGSVNFAVSPGQMRRTISEAAASTS